MTSRDFCYWLQGFFEVAEPSILSEGQINKIKAHLAMVFEHEIDPSINSKHNDGGNKLSSIHGPNLIRC